MHLEEVYWGGNEHLTPQEEAGASGGYSNEIYIKTANVVRVIPLADDVDLSHRAATTAQ